MASSTVKKTTAAGKQPAASKRSNNTAGNGKSKSKGSSSRNSAGTRTAAKSKSTTAEVKRTTELPITERETANPMIMREAVLWLVLAVCILLFISYFGIGGYIGEVICDISFGVFGITAYLLPFLIFLAAAFLISNRGSQIAGMKFACFVVLFVCICSFAGLFAGQHEKIYSIGQLYDMSAAQKNGGGAVGGSICQVLSPAIGAIGTGIVLAILSIVCIVLITQKSLMRSMKRQSTRMYQNARENSARKKEARREELEQREEWKRLEKNAVSLPEMGEAFRDSNDEPRRRGPRVEREPVMVDRVAPDPGHTRRMGGESGRNAGRTVTADSAQAPGMYMTPEVNAQPVSRSGRTQIDVPILFPVSQRERRTGHRVSGITQDTKIYAAGEGIASEVHELTSKPSMRAAYESQNESKDTCYISLDEKENVQENIKEEVRDFAKPEQFTNHDLTMDPEPIMDPELTMDHETTMEPEPAMNHELRIEGIPDVSDSASDFRMPHLKRPGIALELDESDFPDMEKSSAFTEEETGERSGVITRKSRRNFADEVFRDASSEAAPSTSGTVFRAQPNQAKHSENCADNTVSEEKAENSSAVPRENAPCAKRNPRSSQKEIEEGIASVEEEMAKSAKMVKPEYVYPPLDLLKKGKNNTKSGQEQEIRRTAAKLEQTLNSFGVHVTVTNVSCGPSVTRYEVLPKQGVTVSKIVARSDDIKLNLAAADIRIEAPIPGKAAVGIEVPNGENSMVALRDLLESEEFQKHPSLIAFATGKDIGGKVVVSDIAKMPHLLVAGATGSGKSVCINTIIMSILYKAHPDEVKLIMIDPKVVELSVYNGIPHLFIPVVTDPKKAAGALNWAVVEMTQRYEKFAEYGVRDLKGYNKKIEALDGIEDENKPQKLPQIVIIVDELADLMMVAPGEVEDSICRLAQLARAAGIHLIIATQRPSVNVITGLIKANMPSRIAFSVSSGVDSRTIIDMNGAEKLLGKGDMLFYPQGYQKPARVQGAFVSDEEVADVVDFLKNKNTDVSYNAEMEEQIAKVQQAVSSARTAEDVDALFADAGRFIIDKDKASIGMLQRVFKIGFNRAARIMDQLSEAGVVGPEEGTKPRKILMSMEQFENYLEQNG